MRVLLDLNTGTWHAPLVQIERAVHHRGREFAPGTLLLRPTLTHMASRLRRIYPRNEQAKVGFRPRARTMQSACYCAMEIVIFFFTRVLESCSREDGVFTCYLSLSMLYTRGQYTCSARLLLLFVFSLLWIQSELTEHSLGL